MRTGSEMMRDMVACTTREQAAELVRNEIDEMLSRNANLLQEQARSIVLSNIGYLTGYLRRPEAGRMLDLFETRHPYFGAIEEWPKTSEEALDMGRKLGERISEERRTAPGGPRHE